MASYSNLPPRYSPQEIASRRVMDANALKLLESDYARLAMLFAEFERMASRGDIAAKKGIATRIFLELTVHMQVVEEILHPAACAAVHDNGVAKRALSQHTFVRRLIDQLETMSPSDDCYDIKMMALGDYALRDVEREEAHLLPRIRKDDMELGGIGAELLSRRSQLMSVMRLS